MATISWPSRTKRPCFTVPVRPLAGGVALHAVDAPAGEDAGVEAHRLLGPAVLRPGEHQARHDGRLRPRGRRPAITCHDTPKRSFTQP